jgi:hypothetical protein
LSPQDKSSQRGDNIRIGPRCKLYRSRNLEGSKSLQMSQVFCARQQNHDSVVGGAASLDKKIIRCFQSKTMLVKEE